MSSKDVIATLRVLALVAILAAPGCASVPYEFGAWLEDERTLALRPGEPQIERGRPSAVVDGLGHYLFSLPTKLLLLSWKVDNHRISPETEASLREYLDENGLRQVKIRLNQYAPGDEWRRLFDNRDVSAFWRYTAGVVTVAAYTILPQRLLGGDNYNPFTNTVSLYSDLRAIALHEAGHAKDFAGRGHKGTYAALRLLPLVPLFQEADATGDAIGYERVRGSSAEEKRAYRILYPAYGTYVGGEAARWVPGPAWLSYAIGYGMAIPGHIAGWIRSGFVDERPRPDPEVWEIPEPGLAPEPPFVEPDLVAPEAIEPEPLAPESEEPEPIELEPPQPPEARNANGAALLARTAPAIRDSR